MDVVNIKKKRKHKIATLSTGFAMDGHYDYDNYGIQHSDNPML